MNWELANMQMPLRMLSSPYLQQRRNPETPHRMTTEFVILCAHDIVGQAVKYNP
jgi:hypothetical protein